MVKNRIKAGDYMYVEYGHNHKTGGVSEYIGCLDKYYQACKAVGATLILVGPIDRINNYDSSTNTWSTSLAQFSRAAKGYVDTMRYGGEEAANTYVSTYKESGEAAAEAYKETVLADNAEVQVSNVTFVDLNEPSLRFFESVTAKGTVNDTVYINTKSLINFYFCTKKNGSTDSSHPNDTGAENLVYNFFTTADTDAYPELKPLMANFAAGKPHEEPTRVSDDIINLGWAGKSNAWPAYEAVSYDYPLVIKKIVTGEDGRITGMSVYKQDSMESYASGVLKVYNADSTPAGEYVTADHIDQTWENKNTYEIVFAEPITVSEDQTYEAYMWSCSMDEERLLTEEEGGKQLSANFTATDIDAYMITGDGSDIETFDYYGYTSLTDTGKYTYKGSVTSSFALGDEDGRTYADIIASSTSGTSYWLYRAFENLSGGTGTSGKYIFDADIKYNSGSGLEVAFAPSVTNNSPYVNNPYELFTIGSNGAVTVKGTSVGSLNQYTWTNIKYILDMNAATATVSINGSDPVVVVLSDYAVFTTPAIGSMNYLVFTQAARSATFNASFSNMTVGKLTDDKAKTTLTVASEDDTKGSVYIGEAGVTQSSVDIASAISATAAAESGYRFTGWYEGDELFSNEADITIDRLYRDVSLTAKFVVNTAPATVKVTYVDSENNEIKTADTITRVDDEDLFSGDAFTLGESYKKTIKADAGNGKYLVYTFDAGNVMSIDSLAAGENEINLKFNSDGIEYYYYDDFEYSSDISAITASSRSTNTILIGNKTNSSYFLRMYISGNAGSTTYTMSSAGVGAGSTATFHGLVSMGSSNSAATKFSLQDTAGTEIFSLSFGSYGGSLTISDAENTELKSLISVVKSGGITNAGSTSDTPWLDITATVDFTATRDNVAITILDTSNSNKVVYSGTLTTSATNISKIVGTLGKSYSGLGYDNISLY